MKNLEMGLHGEGGGVAALLDHALSLQFHYKCKLKLIEGIAEQRILYYMNEFSIQGFQSLGSP